MESDAIIVVTLRQELNTKAEMKRNNIFQFEFIFLNRSETYFDSPPVPQMEIPTEKCWLIASDRCQ